MQRYLGRGVLLVGLLSPCWMHLSAQPRTNPQDTRPQVSKPEAIQKPSQSTNSGSYWRQAIKPDVLPAWVGGIAACAASIAALITLGKISKQTDAALVAATAAKKSADAQINIERPWLLVEGLTLPRFSSVSLADVRKLQGTLEYRIKNYGKTPARVHVCEIRLEVGDSLACPPNPNGVFAAPDSFVNPHIIPQSDDRTGVIRCVPNCPLTDNEDAAILAKTAVLWAFGLIRYEDVHGGFYETRICFRYDPDKGGLILDGPPGYNNAT